MLKSGPVKYGRPQDFPIPHGRPQDTGYGRLPFSPVGKTVEEIMEKAQSKRTGGTIQEEADETGTVSAFFKNLFSALTSNETLPKRFRLFVKKHGREPIKSIKVVRAPVAKVADTVMNIITTGNFADFKKKAGIDTVYHVGLMINDKYVIEKLERLEAREEPGHDKGEGTESFDVPMSGEMTIAEFLEKGRKRMGQAFYTYSALSSNCQDFTIAMLRANGLLTQDVLKFAKQDTDALVKQFSETQKFATKKVTDVARDTGNVIDELVYKRGGMIGGQRHSKRIGF